MGLWKKLLGEQDEVKLVHKYAKVEQTPIGEVSLTFEVYRAASEQQAREFLSATLVSGPRVRVVVETPEGAFTKDVRGIHGPFASGI